MLFRSGRKMYFELKENRPHGTPENPFSQYHISDVKMCIRDRSVAVSDGITHVVCDHHGCQAVLLDDFVCESEHFSGCLRV